MTNKQVEKVRGEIKSILSFLDGSEPAEDQPNFSRDLADQILAHPKLAILDDDQELPDGGFYETTAMYSEAVRILLKANFRRIIGEETE